MKFIINASKKKTGTTFVYEIFKKNEKVLQDIYVPVIKEWYVFPRISDGYFNLKNHIQKSTKISDLKSQRDKIFYLKIINDSYRTKIIEKIKSKNFDEVNQLNLNRLKEIIKISKHNDYFLISDPNFLDDFNIADKKVINFLKSYEPKFFSIIRNPVNSTLSLLKMIDFRNVRNKNSLINTFNRQFNVFNDLYKLKNKFSLKNILLIDFDELIQNTYQSVMRILEYCEIQNNQNIKLVKNPNPQTYSENADEKYIIEFLNKTYDYQENKYLFENIKKNKYLYF